jgi:hypothetical protein
VVEIHVRIDQRGQEEFYEFHSHNQRQGDQVVKQDHKGQNVEEERPDSLRTLQKDNIGLEVAREGSDQGTERANQCQDNKQGKEENNLPVDHAFDLCGFNGSCSGVLHQLSFVSSENNDAIDPACVSQLGTS